MEVTKEKMEHIRAYQRAYYQEHRDDIKKKAKEYYLRASEGVVSRRNKKFNFTPAVNGALKSPDDPTDVIFEQLPKKGPGRPPKDPNAPKKPKRDPNEPKRPVGRPRKERTEEQKNPVGRPRKLAESQMVNEDTNLS